MVKIIPLPTVTSDGVTGTQFIEIWKEKNKKTFFYQSVEDMLMSKSFNKNLTKEVIYNPVIVDYRDFPKEKRFFSKIIKEAIDFGCVEPPVELATILRLKLTNKEIKKLGFDWLIPVHKPLVVSNKKLRFIIDSREKEFPFDTFGVDNLPSSDTGLIFLLPVKNKK
ncbi:MAG: hypothetical protein NT068_00080 [Candidatus Nomurabacteria bacterium]|nr:hypothetical protein [Candidatus Nomurabacteria bacterium]